MDSKENIKAKLAKVAKDMTETVEYILSIDPNASPDDMIETIDMELSACSRRMNHNLDKETIQKAKDRANELLDRRLEWMEKKRTLKKKGRKKASA